MPGEMVMKQVSNCDCCTNYRYDEDYGYYICEADLDEDELEHFLSSSFSDCPYFRLDDEYGIVQKQM